MRRFSYTDGVMIRHSNALGLSCEYRWETIDGQPRVIEHTTSDGEHFRFRYDLQARTTWVIDVLGRELEIHYNADHRVTSSRDYGGERFNIDLDDIGNMTSLTLPDGNQPTFEYDEHAWLLQETDPLCRTITYLHEFIATRPASRWINFKFFASSFLPIKEDQNWANNPATNQVPSTQS
ncbi:hypothetical protein AO275_05455 [Pseudomonas viridiflava]|nr:hypothetical protein AO275_05455 [Pseudomonas viridiflava]